MIRILHAADLHLDSPFAALAPGQAAQRREEQRQLILRLTRICTERDCQLLLLAGDLFDSALVYRETLELLCEALGSVRARVFIAPGNHDPWSPSSPYATLSWPENVHIFRSRRIEAIRLREPAVTVYGAAFSDAHSGSLLPGFRADSADAASVMVLHGTLGDPGSVYNPISEQDVLDSGLDYLALGHVHKLSLRRIGAATAANPGCAMGRGFDETGPKGALYVELDGGSCRVEPVPLGGRRYESLTVRIEDSDVLAAIVAQLPAGTERDIYRIALTGHCPPPDLPALHAALAGRFYALELVDRSLPPQSLWDGAAEDNLKGEFLRRLQARFEAEQDPETRRIAADAARLGLALMDRREVPEL